jgi:hypothetical protein
MNTHWDEVHDTPDTLTRRHCWVAVRYWPTPAVITYFSTSKRTGRDFPAEWRAI